MHLPWRRALTRTASKILTRTALVLLTSFNIPLVLISACLLTSILRLDFYYLFHHNWVFISGDKGSAFCSIDRKKKHQVLVVLKSCDRAKYEFTNGQFFKNKNSKPHRPKQP